MIKKQLSDIMNEQRAACDALTYVDDGIILEYTEFKD